MIKRSFSLKKYLCDIKTETEFEDMIKFCGCFPG